MICTQNKYALISIAPTWFQDEGGHDRVCGTRQIQKHTDPQFESVAVSTSVLSSMPGFQQRLVLRRMAAVSPRRWSLKPDTAPRRPDYRHQCADLFGSLRPGESLAASPPEWLRVRRLKWPMSSRSPTDHQSKT